MQISPRFYSFRNIFMFLKNLFMSLFLYISYLLSANWLLQIYEIKRAKSIALKKWMLDKNKYSRKLLFKYFQQRQSILFIFYPKIAPVTAESRHQHQIYIVFLRI